MSDSARFSIVILTLDEEINLGACLESCRGCDDIHVLDSGSKDRTQEIARQAGVGLWINPFRSFGAQRNWAIDNIPMKHEWVLHLDADERLTPELQVELRETIARAPSDAGFYLPSKLIFMGRWLKRAGGYPTYQMRFFHKARMRFSDYGHGQRELTDGTIGTLKEPYLHLAFSKGLDDWFAKHNRYSSQEALQALESRSKKIPWSDLFRGDRVARRRAMKQLAYRAPCRAQLRMLHVMFVQGAVLEGRAGLTYAALISTYERMMGLKLSWLLAEHRAAMRQQAASVDPERRDRDASRSTEGFH